MTTVNRIGLTGFSLMPGNRSPALFQRLQQRVMAGATKGFRNNALAEQPRLLVR
jgi:hypothetical protein